MKNEYLFALIVLSMTFSSCGKMMLNLVSKTSIDSQVKTLRNQEDDRTLVFLPMVHLGKPGYYKSAKTIIDSLRKEDFIVFYEGIGIQRQIDSASLDTVNRKLRKLLGFHLSKSYKDSTNLSYPKAITDNNYIMQDYILMGIDMAENKRVDLPKDEIIRRYEEEVKPIILTSCDLETPLKAKYKCKDQINHNTFYAIQIVRNKHIINEVLESEEKKIIMVYGKAHWKFLWPGLRDAGFEITEGRMFNSIL